MENITTIIVMLSSVILVCSFIKLTLDRLLDVRPAPKVFAVIFCFFFTFFFGVAIFELLIPTRSFLSCFLLGCINCFLLLGIFQTRGYMWFDGAVWRILTWATGVVMWTFRFLLRSDIGRGVLTVCAVIFVVWVICVLFDIQFLSINFVLLITLTIVVILFLLSLRK